MVCTLLKAKLRLKLKLKVEERPNRWNAICRTEYMMYVVLYKYSGALLRYRL